MMNLKDLLASNVMLALVATGSLAASQQQPIAVNGTPQRIPDMTYNYLTGELSIDPIAHPGGVQKTAVRCYDNGAALFAGTYLP